MTTLEDIYAQVPDARCKGLCEEACGPLPMTVEEGRRLRRAGHPIPHEEVAMVRLIESGSYSCPALVDGRCSVYEIRPLICRLYGAIENMRCEHGCIPLTGLLTHEQASELISAVTVIGGGER